MKLENRKQKVTSINKWTIKDVLMHIIDTERGFSYRAIVCIRQDDKAATFKNCHKVSDHPPMRRIGSF